ncbi:hypothetical protein HBI56_060430 [Parastagonospora nodorum]|nr:hypothetical protein HBH51_096920 [Parastagonospora nodorum]KAH4036237.1 hypothetical protein HBI09_084450 [Parastagonospora nodorum]KAH4050422.1 hypothetical protein HBH49_132280 [Parastagonospora nodorum]KAH4119013.1 hypothetical protein HBH47_132560 [Parastagonospora nodorum]KAH4204324.1 hypothetical protein HBI95_151220 [Parastagonospora nodorum]
MRVALRRRIYSKSSSPHRARPGQVDQDSDMVPLNQNGAIQRPRMKRKRSADLASAPSQKRQIDNSNAIAPRLSLLIKVLREYELLALVVTNLCADDLLALALTAKALHGAIMPRSVSLRNLLGRLRCSGRGIAIRNRCHQKSRFFYEYDCTEYVQCGSTNTNREVETKPCVTCKVATCDECRVHCVYQSIFQASNDPEDTSELPNFSGFVMLKPHEHPILSPHHLVAEPQKQSIERWQDPLMGCSKPYHDQGYLDAPLVSLIPAPPESIEDVLDLDLGEQSLMTFHEDSRYGRPSPALASLCEVSESRRIALCDDCFDHKGPHDLPTINPEVIPPREAARRGPCHCTMRRRFLDRWLCLRCYQIEERTIEKCAGTGSSKNSGLCRCGSEACRIACLWCWGEIADEVAHDDDEGSMIDDTVRN